DAIGTAVQQLDAQFLLQLLDALADGGLRQIERDRRLPDRPGLDDRRKIAELSELHRSPLARDGNRDPTSRQQPAVLTPVNGRLLTYAGLFLLHQPVIGVSPRTREAGAA